MMSKVSGALTGRFGCSEAGSIQALKRTPATNSPERPVEASGTRRPLQATTWRAGLSPSAFTCSRSSEESAGREVAPLDGFLAEHVPGFERVAQLQPHAAVLDRAVERKTEFALRLEPRGSKR